MRRLAKRKVYRITEIHKDDAYFRSDRVKVGDEVKILKQGPSLRPGFFIGEFKLLKNDSKQFAFAIKLEEVQPCKEQ